MHKILTLLLLPVLAALYISIPVSAEDFSTNKHAVTVDTVVQGLNHPWGLAFLPDGKFLVTERPGSLRLVSDGRISNPLAGVPEVHTGGQGGLLDIALDNEFDRNRTLFLSYAEPGAIWGVSGTAVASARFEPGPPPRLTSVRVIFRQNRKSFSGRHFGSRLVVAPDNTLFITIGDRGDSKRAQDPFDHAGSLLRINRDGSIPSDNPFADGIKAAPEIWSIGHRNAQGATLNRASGRVWTVEHGAAGGDEINLPEPGEITAGR